MVGGGGLILKDSQMENFKLGYPKAGSNLNTHHMIGFITENFVYDPQLGMLYTKEDISKGYQPVDVLAMLESEGYRLSFDTLKNALNSSTVSRVSSLKLRLQELPPWDNRDYIGEFCRYVNTTDNSRFEEFFRHWLTAAVGMVLEPENNQAVNRLVFCVQSSQQRIGKTSIARWLSMPFKSHKEFDTPDNSKDAKLDLTNNLIVVIDDIDNWHSRSVKRLKSIISAREIKVRPPYGLRSVEAPRTASFFGTTNSTGFLNEPGDTRWVVFELLNIDWQGYTSSLQAIDLWTQAKHNWTTNQSCKYLTQEQVQYCTTTAENYQVKPETDSIIESYLMRDPIGRVTATEIYQAMSIDDRRLLGSPNTSLGKIGTAISRIYGNGVRYIISGRTYYKLRIIKAYTKSTRDFDSELQEDAPF